MTFVGRPDKIYALRQTQNSSEVFVFFGIPVHIFLRILPDFQSLAVNFQSVLVSAGIKKDIETAKFLVSSDNVSARYLHSETNVRFGIHIRQCCCNIKISTIFNGFDFHFNFLIHHSATAFFSSVIFPSTTSRKYSVIAAAIGTERSTPRNPANLYPMTSAKITIIGETPTTFLTTSG